MAGKWNRAEKFDSFDFLIDWQNICDGAFKLHSNMEENWEIFLKDEAIGNWNVVE